MNKVSRVCVVERVHTAPVPMPLSVSVAAAGARDRGNSSNGGGHDVEERVYDDAYVTLLQALGAKKVNGCR
jgi:hypothetical protein